MNCYPIENWFVLQKKIVTKNTAYAWFSIWLDWLLCCNVVFYPSFWTARGRDNSSSVFAIVTGNTIVHKSCIFCNHLLTVACGIATLALQNYSSIIWIKTKTILSMTLTIISVVIFIASLQPYVACFTFVLLIIKGALLLKRPWHEAYQWCDGQILSFFSLQS